ncbi:MAG: 2-isopropylmalate synthase [Rhodospirillaceae bacterium]|nr:2-isopropylmalate synthase [Rhodospirillaceae bacterium]
MSNNHVTIFDTTLRDGEQSPGASMTADDKVRIAKILEEMRVDVIEAGFPAASPGDFAAVEAVAGEVKSSIICGLARAIRADIDQAGAALKHAVRGRIHTFIATSPLHMRYKLQMEPYKVYEIAIESVKRARNLIDDVEWSAEDATRSDPDFLCQCVEGAIAAGARTINIPDTVGYTIPEEHNALIKMLFNRVPNIDKAVISVHCHNDLGLAVANSLSAVQAGARQVECTINGLGERAGNAALEEIVMALATRRDRMPFTTGVNSEMIARASQTVSAITGFAVQPNKAIVGANAFAHESGIHQDGMLKHRGTYEIMSPASVGVKTSNLVLGKHSGRAAFKSKLAEMGYALGENAVEDAFTRFKALADRKREIHDGDIASLIDDSAGEGRIKLSALEITCGTRITQPVAEVELEIEGVKRTARAIGDGPVDAAFNAIKDLTTRTQHLRSYQVQAVTGGTDAQARAAVRLEENGRSVTGHGTDVDTLVASAKAYVDALNRLTLRRRAARAAAAE